MIGSNNKLRRTALITLLTSSIFGCTLTPLEKLSEPPNLKIVNLAPGYESGIKRIENKELKNLLKTMPDSIYTPPGRHRIELEISIPKLTPPLGLTGWTVITRCMWIDILENDSYIIETKVNSRKPLYRVRSESGRKVLWGDCNLKNDYL